MIRSKEVTYNDVLKVEFREMLEHLCATDRKRLHMYQIGRICSHGALVGFDYGFYTLDDEPGVVGQYLSLRGYGRLEFHISCNTGYGEIVTKNKNEMLRAFLDSYSTLSGIGG